jgi:formiminoglutamase
MSFLEVTRGDSPLVLGLPHTGTDLPPEVAEALNDVGRALTDTDWHVHRLYDGLADNITTVRTRLHRYVIDVNRDPSGASLYPGQATTGLCPLTDFDGRPIHKTGRDPDAAEIERRRRAYHAPYHDALAAELERVRARHGFAILYDAHSIRSVAPFLFDGTLPDFNIGTDGGATCAASIEAAVAGICEATERYTAVLNGRFRGGWTTRHYGRPAEGLHAVQMELAQSTYMTEAPPWSWQPAQAEGLRPVLSQILKTLIRWRP